MLMNIEITNKIEQMDKITEFNEAIEEFDQDTRFGSFAHGCRFLYETLNKQRHVVPFRLTAGV